MRDPIDFVTHSKAGTGSFVEIELKVVGLQIMTYPVFRVRRSLVESMRVSSAALSFIE